MQQAIVTKRAARLAASPAHPQVAPFTVEQTEERNPGLKGKMRKWIHLADKGHADYVGLRRAIIRVGRTMLLDEHALHLFLHQRSAMAPAPSRRGAA